MTFPKFPWIRKRMTVADAAQVWLDHCEQRWLKRRRMELTTLENYRNVTRRYILPPENRLGTVRLQHLKRAHIQRFRDRLLDQGRSRTTVQRILSIVRCLLGHAVDLAILEVNPATGVRVAGRSALVKKVIPPERAHIIRFIEGAPGRVRPMILTTATTGIRSCELRGLRWQDVDLTEGYVHVRQKADNAGRLGELNAPAHRRSIPIGPHLKRELREWRGICLENDLDLVFPTGRGNAIKPTNFLGDQFHPLRRALGLNHVAWHDFRHYAIGSWIAQKVTPKMVQVYAGHSNLRTTMESYGHLFPSPSHHDAMAAVERLVVGLAEKNGAC